MTKTLTASAPGKLVLTGEYAVLDGAPAIVSSVAPRASVRISTGDSFSVTALGFFDGDLAFSVRDGKLDWGADTSPLPLFDCVWEALRPAVTEPVSIVLDTSAFAVDGEKLGLGSSAALAVALTGALCEWSGSGCNVDELAFRAHRDFQGGTGSGLDIATSVVGGMIVFTLRDRTVESIPWPEGLEAAVLWSGVASSTASRLAKLYKSEPHQSREALADAAFVAAYAWQDGKLDRVLGETARFGVSLHSFSDAYDLDIYGAGHAVLAALAEHEGLVYKPCGAGGGDTGIALGEDTASIRAFVERAESHGFRELPVLSANEANDGLRIEWTQD